MAEPQLFHADFSGAGEARGTYKNSSANFTMAYIKRKDMKTLYPSGGFNVRGQIGAGREQLGALAAGGENEPQEVVYSVAKLAHKRVAGYVPVGGNDYIAVMRDTLLLWILLMLLALALIAGLAFGIRAAVTANAEPETTTNAAGVVDPNAQLGEGELDVPDHIDTAGTNIQFSGITEMHFVAGQREQNYIFSNPEVNPCYFKITISLSDTGETIYTSDLLPPGYSISRFTLDRALAAGEYNVVVHFDTFSFDREQRPLNKMDFKTVIIAEEAE